MKFLLLALALAVLTGCASSDAGASDAPTTIDKHTDPKGSK